MTEEVYVEVRVLDAVAECELDTVDVWVEVAVDKQAPHLLGQRRLTGSLV